MVLYDLVRPLKKTGFQDPKDAYYHYEIPLKCENKIYLNHEKKNYYAPSKTFIFQSIAFVLHGTTFVLQLQSCTMEKLSFTWSMEVILTGEEKLYQLRENKFTE